MATILVVDDSAMDRQLAGRILDRRSDWHVLYANDGTAALGQIELHLPDIVVTDLQMPGLDGLELVAAVKRDFPLIPVVLMTAQGSEETAVKALRDGAASYVPKRILAMELADTVSRVLAASGVDRSHSRLLSRMSRTVADFNLENDLTLIPSVVNYLQQIVTRMRLCSETDVLRQGVALEEALLNAYYHGNLEVSSSLREEDHKAYYDLARQRMKESPYRERRIFVNAFLEPGRAQYIIRDEGPGFDPDLIPDATDPGNIEKPCGRGLLLMQTFMDDVQFNDSGNEVTLVKNRSADAMSEDEPEPGVALWENQP